MLIAMRVARALLVGLALVLVACGRVTPEGPAGAPPGSTFEALIAGAPDPEGGAVTTLFDSASGRSQTTMVPTNATAPRFTAGGAISYLLPDAIRSEDTAGGSRRTLVAGRSLLLAGFAWGPGGTLAYLGRGAARNPGSWLFIARPGSPPASVALPASPGGPPVLRFSPDGRLLLLVDSEVIAGATRTTLQVLDLDGRLVYGPAAVAAGTAAATWAGEGRLYFWDGAGVNATDLATGATRTILPGVRWYDPDTSPDGASVVFVTRDPRGLPRLQLLDTATDRVEAGFERDGGSLPRFVSPGVIWFHEAGSGGALSPIVSLDVERLTEAPTGLTGFVTDVRQIRPD
jgi:hypothetical protein